MEVDKIMCDTKCQEKYTLLSIDSYEDLRETYASFGIRLAASSFLKEDQQMLALGIHSVAGETCGIASGVYSPKEKRFLILGLYIRRQDRSKELVRAVLGDLLGRARQQFHPDLYAWEYKQKEEGHDPRLSLVKGLDLRWLSPAVRRRAGALIKLDTAILRESGSKMRHNRSYWSPEHVASLGYAFLPWETCGEEIKGKIRAMLALPEENTEGLSPFVGDEYDPDTSFVLAHEDSVCGWVICAKFNDGVEIRRWYIARDARRNRAGQFLGAYMLQVIQERYKAVYFEVLEHSKSMLRFAKGYLGEAIVEEIPLYRLEMKESG